MITEEMIGLAANQGNQALKKLFENLPKEDALKGLGIMVIAGFAYYTIKQISEIVLKKQD